MAKFKTKTQSELHIYFSGLSLQQLIEINHSYESHFVNLETRIEEKESSLVKKRIQFQSAQAAKAQLYTEAPTLEERDKVYFQTRDDLQGSVQGAELYLARQILSLSPSDQHRQSLYRINSTLDGISQDISKLTTELNTLNTDKSRAVEELILLNRIIENKKREASELTNSTVQPHYAI